MRINKEDWIGRKSSALKLRKQFDLGRKGELEKWRRPRLGNWCGTSNMNKGM